MKTPRSLLLALLALVVLAVGLPATAPAGAATSVPALTRVGDQLRLDGRPARLGGVNGFSLTTWWATNWGCGSQVGDLDGLFAGLGRGALVRTWAFQALGYDNKRAHQIDFTGIDRVVRAAERHGVLLELALSDQAGTCDDGRWHDRAWYAGGYRTVRNDDGRGLTPLSYAQWVDLVVTRYRSSPAVAVWQPVNEPEASDCRADLRGGACVGHGTCASDATLVLRRFYDVVGARVKALDPGALVASGAIGGGQCGLAGDGYAQVHASAGLDIATFHDYGAEDTALPEQLADRLRTANALGKPLLVDEAGVGAGQGCRTVQQRASLIAAKRRAAEQAGADGYLPWWYAEQPQGGCTHALSPGDPAFAQLRTTFDAPGAAWLPRSSTPPRPVLKVAAGW